MNTKTVQIYIITEISFVEFSISKDEAKICFNSQKSSVNIKVSVILWNVYILPWSQLFLVSGRHHFVAF